MKKLSIALILAVCCLSGCSNANEVTDTVEDAVEETVIEEVEKITPMIDGKEVELVRGADPSMYYKANMLDCSQDEFDAYRSTCSKEFTDIYVDESEYFLAHSDDQKYQFSAVYYPDDKIIFVVTEDVEAINAVDSDSEEE